MGQLLMPPKFYVGQQVRSKTYGTEYFITSIDPVKLTDNYKYWLGHRADKPLGGFLLESQIEAVFQLIEDGPITYR